MLFPIFMQMTDGNIGIFRIIIMFIIIVKFRFYYSKYGNTVVKLLKTSLNYLINSAIYFLKTDFNVFKLVL